MEKLKFHTQDLPQMAEAGARYVVVAHFGEWRDGLTTNYKAEIPKLQRELRKRFMKRFDSAAMTDTTESRRLARFPRVNG
jgi:hypothetical protein